MEKTLLAVPSEAPGGLDAQMASHFGHCALYTLVETEDGAIRGVTVLPNVAHEHGGCLAPVQLLAEKGVHAMIAGGMGMRPLAGFRERGINVYRAAGGKTVREAVEMFLEGGLTPFSEDFTCRGNCHH